MGYENISITVWCSLSRHNSPKDEEHNALWEDFKKRVEDLMNDPKYSDIQLGW